MTAHTDVLADLVAEGDDLEQIVVGLTPAQWATPTPAAGWSVAHQVAHLAWTDRVALVSATDPDAFADEVAAAMADPTGFVDTLADQGAARPPAELLEGWRAGRAALVTALAGVAPGVKLPWYGPPMSATSMATARIMETWAHGQDVADAVRVDRAPTARLRHVAHLGVRTRDFAYLLRDLTPPAEPFRVELTAPTGDDVWTWGPDDAAQRVTGPALEFCLLVTQRRHRDDLAVRADGPDADAWLGLAQAFAGVPGPGRARRGAA